MGILVNSKRLNEKLTKLSLKKRSSLFRDKVNESCYHRKSVSIVIKTDTTSGEKAKNRLGGGKDYFDDAS